mmetsp:Transcript_20896/g.72085  ORF Transcript_20896/g.72085 Transcript_20896/m.72085 type:complete len:218 (+) Transcript_20896:699-1352(+)
MPLISLGPRHRWQQRLQRQVNRATGRTGRARRPHRDLQRQSRATEALANVPKVISFRRFILLVPIPRHSLLITVAAEAEEGALGDDGALGAFVFQVVKLRRHAVALGGEGSRGWRLGSAWRPQAGQRAQRGVSVGAAVDGRAGLRPPRPTLAHMLRCRAGRGISSAARRTSANFEPRATAAQPAAARGGRRRARLRRVGTYLMLKAAAFTCREVGWA